MQTKTSKAAVASKAATIGSRSNAAATVKSGAAKRRLSKADKARKAEERAIASASKRLEHTTLEEARAAYAAGEIRTDGLRNVYAVALNEQFAFMLKEHKLHWSVLWNSRTQRNEQSNMHPLWKAVEAERLALVELLEARNHSNPAKVWQRVRERGYQIAHPGQKRAPTQPGKLPAEQAIERLIAAYKVVAKETVQSARDGQIADILGRALIALEIDIEEINRKIG